MSLLDVINAQKALAVRLRMWGVEVDVKARADSFIDDLVRQGWQMSAQREGRPHPPKATEQCQRCGGILPGCACTREHLAAVYDDEPAAPPPATWQPGDTAAGAKAARDAIHAAKAAPANPSHADVSFDAALGRAEGQEIAVAEEKA
jgi:hypothetical protein